VGERIRSLVLDPRMAGVDARTEALLMAAARAQHVAEVIEPALIAGRDVVTDRFTASSLAYQGFARGLGTEAVAALSDFATGGLVPDLYVLLDVPEAEARGRREVAGAAVDRMEAEAADFHLRVAEGFRALAADDPARWAVVDGCGRPDEVEERVWSAVDARLPGRVLP
jgi:dTMP kinase